MNEQFPKPEVKMTKAEYIQLARELSQNPEGFKFQGLDDASYAKLKASDEQFPGYTTPIDELIQRFAAHGIKVAFGDHPESGNVYILPLDSDDEKTDSVLPRHLRMTDDMDPELKKLILHNKEIFESNK